MKRTKDLINLITEHEVALHQFIVKYVGNIDVAADILQKVCEKLLHKNSILQVENHQAYLFKMARNEAIDYFRSEERRYFYESQSAQISVEYNDLSGDKVLAASQELHLLQQALNELPLLTQKIFIMYRVDAIKQQEIARQLKLNLSTIEKRLAIAMKHCRMRLQQSDYSYSLK